MEGRTLAMLKEDPRLMRTFHETCPELFGLALIAREGMVAEAG
jgi:hypothetical protein